MSVEAPKLILPPDRPPLFVAAGIIKTEEESLRYTEADHLAVQVLGSISEKENKPEDLGPDFHFNKILRAADNSVRLRNPGSEAVSGYAPRIIDAAHDAGQLVIIAVTSLAGEDPEEVLPRLAVWAHEMGADGIELNGSCPNQKGGLLCEDARKTAATCYAVREAVGDMAYLTLKVPRLGKTQVDQLKRSHLPLDGVVAINALKLPPMISPQTEQPYVKTKSGYVGRSGPIISGVARDELRAWLGSDYDIWSVGGVDNGHEAYDRKKMGAFAVGGAQELRRADDPVATIERWGEEYYEFQALDA